MVNLIIINCYFRNASVCAARRLCIVSVSMCAGYVYLPD